MHSCRKEGGLTDPERVIQKFKESIDASIATVSLNVVVMGPNLQEDSDAGRLRKRLIRAAKDYGAAIQPEHRGLARASRSRLGEGHHLTALEMHLVKVSDLVVLIPDSPGSMCELGLFSFHQESARKMLILVNAEYPRRGTYVADGPLAQAGQNGSTIEYVDYRDLEACWALVRSRIEQIRGQKSLRMMAGGSE